MAVNANTFEPDSSPAASQAGSNALWSDARNVIFQVAMAVNLPSSTENWRLLVLEIFACLYFANDMNEESDDIINSST